MLYGTVFLFTFMLQFFLLMILLRHSCALDAPANDEMRGGMSFDCQLFLQNARAARVTTSQCNLVTTS
jgi:hypothetical protein